MKRIISIIVLIIWFGNELLAQEADFLRSTGKIYGVYSVVLILLLGLAIYLFTLDRKISKIEKSIEDE